MGLLQRIYNNNAPKKIRDKYDIYELNESKEDYTNYNCSTFLFHKLGNSINTKEFLNYTVEILPEENDEWEDIEEYQYSIIPSHFDLQNAIKTINRNFETHQKALESIIKNQKYLKEKLEEK